MRSAFLLSIAKSSQCFRGSILTSQTVYAIMTRNGVDEMLFQNIAILDENLNAKEGMYVGVKDKKIDYIGKKRRLSISGEVATCAKKSR